jgi:hypothetical protein
MLVEAVLFCVHQRTSVLLLDLSFRLCFYKSFLNWMLGPTKTIILVYEELASQLSVHDVPFKVFHVQGIVYCQSSYIGCPLI